MPDTTTIYIDGKEIKAQKGENLLNVALKNGISIPNLCYHKNLSPTGACRMCIVKVEGMRGYMASCTVNINDGMKITAFDDELEQVRKTTLEMLLSNHNDDCINCTRDGDCELQDLAFRYDLGKSQRTLKSLVENTECYNDLSSPVLDYDASKCIQCERCVKACYEMQGKGVLSLAGRGINTHINAGWQEWKTSECDGCGQCVQSCPTGAIVQKPISGIRVRKKDIEKKVTTTCPYCGVGCQLEISIIGNKIVKVEGADEIPNFTKTCVKGRFGLDFVDRPERLKKPLIKLNGEFIEVEWEEALNYTAQKLTEIKNKYGSQALMGVSSARCLNEENYVIQKFVRTVFENNNIDHCARLCHASTVAGLANSFGSGAMTNSIEELEQSDVILITGSNTTETHPVIATHIKRAVLFNNAKVIVIEPRKIDLVKYSTLWLQEKNGTDVVWINGMINVILNENIQNQKFIDERTENFNELKKTVEKYTPEYVEEITGIPTEQLIQAARIYAGAQKASIIYSMGITQHSHGTDNVKSLANLAMVTGNIGKKSSGVNPLRGQNNVQGACDTGALPNVYPGYQKVDDPNAQEKFEKAWGVPLSNKFGLTITEMMDKAIDGEIKAIYLVGENPMVSDPNISHVREALESVEFLVCQDIFPTETTELADVIFPSASFAEKDGTYTNTERRVLPVNKIIEPIGESKPDWWIIQEIAKRMGYEMNYSSHKDILAEINSLTPSYAGITYDRIMQGEKLQWPCPSIDHPGTKYLHKDKFTKGKGTFFAIDYIPSKEIPSKDYPFVLSTGRVLYHYHTGTMTRKTKALPQYVEGPYVEINDTNAQNLGIESGDTVKVSSRRGKIILQAVVTDKVAIGSVFIPFHFAEAAANMLTNNVLDPVAKIPEFKVCACQIEKVISNPEKAKICACQMEK
ncbi:MAG: formate dehydrogenase subunit alpha [Candidatus Melainabacteria bacterium RIFOXYA12_FULL_32_12]|nr:MAG: formate dehydrogenase subunit alpha [Candidatus Melainabacteria bacterium RIFOXYA12_FULL_32_12]